MYIMATIVYVQVSTEMNEEMQLYPSIRPLWKQSTFIILTFILHLTCTLLSLIVNILVSLYFDGPFNTLCCLYN